MNPAEKSRERPDGECCVQAQLALSQFHVTDRMTRQQYYYLNLLEPEPHSPETHLQGTTATTATAVLLQGCCSSTAT